MKADMIHRYFGKKGLPDIEPLANIASEGMPVDVQVFHTDLDRASAYNSHGSTGEHPDAVWRKLKEENCRDRAPIVKGRDAHII